MELVARENIIANLEASTKKEALIELAQKAAATLQLDETTVFDALCDREHMGSTGIGEGIALPHAKIPSLDHIVIFFARSNNGIAFDALDNRAVHLFFLLLAPENPASPYLSNLARLSKTLKDSQMREKLLQAENGDSIYTALLGQTL